MLLRGRLNGSKGKNQGSEKKARIKSPFYATKNNHLLVFL
jgi:hypothetical protein